MNVKEHDGEVVTGALSSVSCINQYFIFSYNSKFFHNVHEKELTEHTASWAKVTESLEVLLLHTKYSGEFLWGSSILIIQVN